MFEKIKFKENFSYFGKIENSNVIFFVEEIKKIDDVVRITGTVLKFDTKLKSFDVKIYQNLTENFDRIWSVNNVYNLSVNSSDIFLDNSTKDEAINEYKKFLGLCKI